MTVKELRNILGQWPDKTEIKINIANPEPIVEVYYLNFEDILVLG